ncbi:MAG: RtcB family protein [Sphingobacteriales bacterium]|nr:MAG: RtcB family protein [Sphingobacteriales bacterium]
MKKLSLSGKEIVALGYPESPAIGLLVKIAQKHYRADQKEEALDMFGKVLANPATYAEDEVFAKVVKELLYDANGDIIPLKESGSYAMYGEGFIEDGAKEQMNIAMSLPVTVAGALMPDAHQGYGLPIGGVLATENVVIPYGVGVDIGCRMCLSIYDIPESHFAANEAQYKRELIAHTKFNAGAGFHGQYKSDHEVLDRKEFNMIPFLKPLQDKAYSQLGTSGGGNHFVEWGIIQMLADDNELNIPKGKYLALLSHSGSRGLGATTANHYTRLAKDICKLPRQAANLAYLDLNTQEGQEYWLAMNLAGDFASACHEVIHNKLTKAIGGQLLARVENHHNFAWKEQYEGREVIVHRKGATPAGKGVLGIIPGSMTAPGFLVRGRGEAAAINSASHGAGRQMSRTKANQSFTRQQMKEILREHNVTLIGGGLDEAPGAYKDINAVMNAQSELVDILARFSPRMVRMADDGSRED